MGKFDPIELLTAGWPMVIHVKFTQTRFDRSVRTWVFGPFESEADANNAYDLARIAGWSEPRWWQFWRWDDQPRSTPTLAEKVRADLDDLNARRAADVMRRFRSHARS